MKMRFFRKKEDEDILSCDMNENIELDNEAEEKPSWKKTLLTYAHDVLYLLALLVVLSLVLRVVVVDGTSMNNTLKDGDYLLVLSNVFYRNPKQGDVIVASKETFDNGAPIVKRVIATEGQVVDIDFEEGVVYVNGEELDEPYTLTPTSLYEGINFPLVVGEDCLFVLGDNRNGSRDSRHPSIGLIDEREVIGKVIFLFIPGTNGTDYAGNPKESRDFSRIGVVD
ncbi:MAG: signal peptidase I [Oscillospiraceae bacterium]|nr:signal peptidase I [Oscillospiraceae bacterium]